MGHFVHQLTNDVKWVFRLCFAEKKLQAAAEKEVGGKGEKHNTVKHESGQLNNEMKDTETVCRAQN